MLTPNFTPFPVLETPRLLLRRMTNDDAPAHFLTRTDPEGMKYLDREMAKDVSEIHDMVKLIDNNLANNLAINWAMEIKETGEFIGSMGYYRNDFNNHRGEIGYQIARRFWRKGYSSEAMQAILSYGFEVIGFHSVMADINPANDASRALLEKFGFRQEAYFRQNHYFKGKFGDSAIYCLLQSEFKKK
ncbi:MAG TPA: GNAT family protein [Bacteroidia bacterium]|jgi:ribosomal-protein-alanine N-acetyltransferase|nr:GNAT family protein [Bacteroidia bacterium]